MSPSPLSDLPLIVSLWRTFAVGRREHRTWRSFLDTYVHSPEIVRDKKAVAGFSLASFKNDRRKLAGVEEVFALGLDFDGGTLTLDTAPTLFPWYGVVYTTFSHTPAAPRLRAIFPLSRSVTADEYARVWTWIEKRSTAAGHEPDVAARDASRFWYLPSHRPGAEFIARELPGDLLDVEMILRETPAAEPAGARSKAVGGLARNSTSGGAGGPRPVDRTPSGAHFRLVLERLRDGVPEDEIAEELRRLVAPVKIKRSPDYVARTIEHARWTHEKHTPRAKLEEAVLHRMPARFGHTERTHVTLKLLTHDGEIVEVVLVVPSEFYRGARATWTACFPDVDPRILTQRSWSDVGRAWKAIKMQGREFFVAARNGEVKWIRAAGEVRLNSCRTSTCSSRPGASRRAGASVSVGVRGGSR